MEISKKELKKISKKLSKLSSSVIYAYFEEQNDALKELLIYIEKTELISNYIHSLEFEIVGLEDDIEEIVKSYGRQGLDLGSDSRKKLYLLYKAFKYIIDKDISTTYLGWYYSRGKKYQDMAKAFGDNLIYPFYSAIEDYLYDIAIDMGYDEDSKYKIISSGSGTQIILAEGNSVVEATQNNNFDIDALNEKLEEIKQLIDTIEDVEQKDALIGNVNIISEEVKKPKRDKAVLKNAFNNLKFIGNGISKLPDLVAGIAMIGKILEHIF